MWATPDVSPARPGIPVLPKPVNTPRRPLSLAVSAAKSRPPAANNDVGGLGRTTLTALESRPRPRPRPSPKPKPPTNSIPIPEKEKPRQEEEEKEEEEKQISGSDVLWALQKAAAKKNKASGNKKKNNKKRKSGAVGLSSKAGRGEEAAVDYYVNVRPLQVKIEWSAKLDDLENRLRELSHSK